MTSLQIIDLSFEEDLEDLSFDEAGDIQGGQVTDIQCIQKYVIDFIQAYRSGNLDAIPEILTGYFACIDDGVLIV